MRRAGGARGCSCAGTPFPPSAAPAEAQTLLELMQADAQRPVTAVAEAAGLPVPACCRRMRRLRANGVIARAVAIVGPRTLGWPLSIIARDMESYDDTVQRLFTANARVRAFRTLVVIRQL